MVSHSHKGIGIGDGAEEDTTGTQISRDVLEHHSRFRRRFKGIVHAELHGNVVERYSGQFNWQAVAERLLRVRKVCDLGLTYTITVVSEEMSWKAVATHRTPTTLSLLNGNVGNVCE